MQLRYKMYKKIHIDSCRVWEIPYGNPQAFIVLKRRQENTAVCSENILNTD